MNGKTVIHLIFFLAPLLHVPSHGAAAARMERGALAGAQLASRAGARRRREALAHAARTGAHGAAAAACTGKARAATVVALAPSPACTSRRRGATRGRAACSGLAHEDEAAVEVLQRRLAKIEEQGRHPWSSPESSPEKRKKG